MCACARVFTLMQLTALAGMLLLRHPGSTCLSSVRACVRLVGGCPQAPPPPPHRQRRLRRGSRLSSWRRPVRYHPLRLRGVTSEAPLGLAADPAAAAVEEKHQTERWTAGAECLSGGAAAPKAQCAPGVHSPGRAAGFRHSHVTVRRSSHSQSHAVTVRAAVRACTQGQPSCSVLAVWVASASVRRGGRGLGCSETGRA